jgi:Flp pilus assembly protein TadG
MTLSFKFGRRLFRSLARFGRDTRGLAAVEFAFIVPLMLILIFGTIEVAGGVAIDRKVTLTARTLSDLVSRGTKVSDNDIKNFFGMGSAIMTPYAVTPQSMSQRLTAVYVDKNGVAKVTWSFSGSSTGNSVTLSSTYPSAYRVGDTITTIPSALLVPQTQLIWSEVTYNYRPIAGYFIRSSIALKDQMFTRPRQSDCVLYSTATACPTG